MTLRVPNRGCTPPSTASTPSCCGQTFGRGSRPVVLCGIDNMVDSHADNRDTPRGVLLTRVVSEGEAVIPARSRRALAHRLVDDDRGGRRGVERVHAAVHGDADPHVGRAQRLVGEPELLGPDRDRDPPVRSASVCSVSVSGVVATRRMPASRSQASVSPSVALATGTENTVPLDPRTTLGLPQSVTGSTAMTASTPAASAVRSMAPRLPGFSRPSQTSSSGAGGQLEVGQAGADRRHERDEPVGPLAVGDLLERRPRDPDRLDPEARMSSTTQLLVGSSMSSGDRRASAAAPRRRGPARAPRSPRRRSPGLVAGPTTAQRDELLEPRVGG